MAGEKKFGTSMFGFKKADVNAYIERIIREFDQRLKERDEENTMLKTSVHELRAKYEQLSRESDSLLKEKEKIAGVLLQAQEKAENMMSEAQDKALKEKMRLDQLLESEKEKIVDIKRELKQLRSKVVEILSSYEQQIDEAVMNIENREKLYMQDSIDKEYVDEEENRAG